MGKLDHSIKFSESVGEVFTFLLLCVTGVWSRAVVGGGPAFSVGLKWLRVGFRPHPWPLLDVARQRPQSRKIKDYQYDRKPHQFAHFNVEQVSHGRGLRGVTEKLDTTTIVVTLGFSNGCTKYLRFRCGPFKAI